MEGHGSVRLYSGLVSTVSHVMLTTVFIMALLPFSRGRSRPREGKWPTQVYKLTDSRAKIFLNALPTFTLQRGNQSWSLLGLTLLASVTRHISPMCEHIHDLPRASLFLFSGEGGLFPQPLLLWLTSIKCHHKEIVPVSVSVLTMGSVDSKLGVGGC